jgi:microcin C transport system substrate-binding protein
VAWWDKFAYPQQLPLYYQAQEWMIHTWWQKPEMQGKQ